MNFEISVTKWWAVLNEEPDEDHSYPGYDGRQLIIEGTADVSEHYWESEAQRFNRATCRIHLRPVDKDSEPPKESARWSNEAAGMWVFLNLNLARRLWEDLWSRTLHPRPTIRILLEMGTAEDPSGSMFASLSAIEILN